jgi:hypothetical protein
MIAHVAQAGEGAGRVVLQVSSPQPHALALLAAVKVAQAFQSELESLFIEDARLFDCAAYTFVKETSLSGRSRTPLSAGHVQNSLHLAAQGVRRQLERLARSAQVPLTARVVRDDPLRAVSAACSASGPWNVVALTEPITAAHGPVLRQLFEAIEGTTGLVLIGPCARRVTGPSLVVVEDSQRLSDMVRAAERLSALDEAPVVVLLVAPDARLLGNMDAAARLALLEHDRIRIEHALVGRGMSGVAAEALRRQGAGFVICQFGGAVVPAEEDLGPLTAALECPLLLVR